MQRNNILYSLIIPHFNVPELLKRCLQTVPVRDDLQVLVVDDHSAKESIDILRQMEKDFPHVQFYYSRQNGGGGRARNIGVEKADGKYLLFADADDMFSRDFKGILDDYSKTDADIVFFNVETRIQETLEKAETPHFLTRCIEQSKTDREEALLKLRYLFGEPWCKIVKKEIVEKNQIRFDELPVHNDTHFSYLAGHYSTRALVDERIGYIYYVRSGSVSKNRSMTRNFVKIKVFGASCLFFCENGIPVYEDRHWRALYNILNAKSKEDYKKAMAMFRSIGYSKDDVRRGYAEAVIRMGFFSPLKSALLAPDFRMKCCCVNSWIKNILSENRKKAVATWLSVMLLLFLPFNGYSQEKTVVPSVYEKDFELEIFSLPNTKVNASTGEVSHADNYASTDYLSVENIGRITFELPFSATAGIAFYDSNKKIISNAAAFSVKGGRYEGSVPEGAVYVRLSRRTDSERSKTVVMHETNPATEAVVLTDYDADARMKVRRYRVFSNQEYSYNSDSGKQYYWAAMPNHQMLNDGTIVAVTELFGEKRYLAIKRSTDGGRTWSGDIKLEGKMLDNGLITDNASGGNPVLLYDRKENTLFLFYQPRSYRKSTDGGLTWGEKTSVAHLFEKEYKGKRFYAAPCNGIQLTNGILAIVYRIEKIEDGYDRVCVLFSRDGGDTWEITPSTPIVDKNGEALYADETALVEYEDNRIMLNARGFSEISLGKQVNRRVFVQSNQGSANARLWTVKSWELEPESDLKLIDPVCQGSMIKAELFGKRFGIFTNLYSNTAVRENLLVRVSSDFMHWSQCCFITLPGEKVHGYSSMCCINGRLSLMTEDDKGIFYLPFGYELTDKVMRTYAENKIAYQ